MARKVRVQELCSHAHEDLYWGAGTPRRPLATTAAFVACDGKDNPNLVPKLRVLYRLRVIHTHVNQNWMGERPAGSWYGGHGMSQQLVGSHVTKRCSEQWVD